MQFRYLLYDSEYTAMLEDARKQAIDRLVKNATAMGANTVVMMRFDPSEIGKNMSEVLALWYCPNNRKRIKI